MSSKLISMLSTLKLAIIIFGLLGVSGQSCWKDSYYRGVGLAPYCQDPTWFLINKICYAPCITNYQQKASDYTYCDNICPTLWSDNGASCSKPGGSYGRGVGYGSNGACLSSGDSNLTPRGCETWGLITYPKCTYGYSNIACCVCGYDGGCPSPTTGGSSPCTKDLYLRPSTPWICKPGLVFGTDDLCYTPCLNGYGGDFICRDQSCPPSSPTSCSNQLCTSDAVCSAAEVTETANQMTAINTFIAVPNLQFTVKDIAQANSLTSIAPNICNQQTFTAIDASLNNLHSCNERRYPVFLGSNAGITEIKIFEFDSLGNIGFGGKSTDTSLVSVSSYPFVGHMYQIGFNYTWIYEFNVAAQDVQAIAFSPDMTKMLAIFNSGFLDMFLFEVATGAILSKRVFSTQLQPNIAITVDPVSSWVQFAGSDLSFNLILGGLNIFNQPLTTSMSYLSVLKPIKPTSIAMGLSNQLFVTTDSSLPQSPPTVGVTPCLGVSEFSFSIASSTTWSASYVSSYYNNVNYPKGLLKYKNFGGSQGLFVCANGVALTTYGILITRRFVGSSSPDNIIYQESLTDDLKCLDLTITTSSQLVVMAYNSFRSFLKILTIDFVGGGNYQFTEKLLTKPTMTPTELFWGRVKSATDFYLSGTRSSYFTCMNVAPGQVGIILNSQFNKATDPLITSQSIPILKPLTAGVTYQTYAFPTSSGTQGLGLSGIIAKAIPQLNMYNTLNLCSYQAIVTYPMAYHRYIIDYPEETYDYPDFYFSPVVCNDIFRYWYKRDSVPPIPQLPSFVIYFNWLYPEFKVYTENPIAAGVYTITVTGKLPNHQTQVAPSFVIELFNIPPATFITATYVPDLTYIVSQPKMNHTWQGFIASDLTYYLIYYLEIYDLGTRSWTRNIDTTLFIITQGQKQSMFQIYTLNNAKVGVYQMRIMGKFTPHTAFFDVCEFKVTVKHQCLLTQIIPKEIEPSSFLFEMQVVAPPPIIIVYPEWTDTFGFCDPFIYKAYQADGTYIPNFLKFQANIRQFSITQVTGMKPGFYTIKLVGILQNYFVMNMVFFQITVKCFAKQIKPAQPDQTVNYIVGQPAYRIQIQEFEQLPNCGKAMEYFAVMEDGSDLKREYLQFYVASGSDGSQEMVLSFQANRLPREDSYTVYIKPLIDSDLDGQKKLVGTPLKITFKPRQIDQFVVAEYLPMYIISKSGEDKIFPFGSVQGDFIIETLFTKFQMTYTDKAKTTLQIRETSQPSTLTDSTLGQLTINGETDDDEGSSFIIKSVISDIDGTRFRIFQNIVVYIYKNDVNINFDNERQKMQLLLQRTLKEFNLQDYGDMPGMYGTKSKNKTSKLKARIENVDEMGVVTLRFNLPIYNITNLTYIDETVLKMDIVKAQSERSRNLNFTWIAINMTERDLKIQLNFLEPRSVSIYTVHDELKLTFQDWAETIFQPVVNMSKNVQSFSITQNTVSLLSVQPYESVVEDQELYFPMPLQLPKSCKKIERFLILIVLQKTLSSAFMMVSQGITGSLAINFFLAALLKISMKHVWGIIQFLQIVTHMPFLIPILPTNYQVVLKLIYDVARLKIIPKEYIEKVLKWIQKNLKINLVPTDQDNFFIENLGNIILCLGIALIMLTLILLISFLAIKFQKVRDKIDKLKYKIMFGVFVTTITKGYLNMFVKMLNQVTGGGPQFLTQSATEAETNKNPVGNPWIPFAIVSLLSLAPFFILFFLIANHNYLEREPFKSAWGSLYTNLDTTKPSRYLFYVPFLLRRILYALSINDFVFFMPFSQTLLANVFLQFSLSFALIAYVTLCRPYLNDRDNYLEIFNESTICILFLIPMCALVVDESILDGPARHTLGYVLIGILLLNLFINYLLFLADLVRAIITKIKAMIKKCKQKKPQQDPIVVEPTDQDQNKENLRLQSTHSSKIPWTKGILKASLKKSVKEDFQKTMFSYANQLGQDGNYIAAGRFVTVEEIERGTQGKNAEDYPGFAHNVDENKQIQENNPPTQIQNNQLSNKPLFMRYNSARQFTIQNELIKGPQRLNEFKEELKFSGTLLTNIQQDNNRLNDSSKWLLKSNFENFPAQYPIQNNNYLGVLQERGYSIFDDQVKQAKPSGLKDAKIIY